jgi:UDP-N-acetylglucosamine acyltransferase
VALIHPSSIVHPSAEIADDVEIGPFCTVGEFAKLGSGTRLTSHVVIEKWTELGENNEISPGVVLGGPPQDRKYHGERSFLRIGDNNLIRECVTIHRASGEDTITQVGNNNFLMAYMHIGHNSTVGSNITIANGVAVAGHVRIEDFANFGGLVGVHQKVRVGKYAMVGGMTRVNVDVPPFMIVEGNPMKVKEINAVGLRRAGVSSETRMALRKAVKILFRSRSNLTKAIEMVEKEIESFPEVVYLLDFMRCLKNGRFGRAQDEP